MDVISTVAAVVLGVVFLVSGGSKIASHADWTRLSAEFGAPPIIRVTLPWTELILGALLIVQIGRPVVAVAALVLLVGFTIAIVVRLRQGRHPQCACFGAWSSRPLGWGHVARNLVLMAVAIVAAL